MLWKLHLMIEVFSFISVTTTLKFNLVERNHTAVGHYGVANSTLTVAARTVVECGMHCSNESLCAAFEFDVYSKQCMLYLGCVNPATGTVLGQYSTSETYAKQILYRTDLALGKTATYNTLVSSIRSDISVITDGVWSDAYVVNSAEETAELFCLNPSYPEGYWFMIDMNQSFVVCAVNVYTRANVAKRGDILITVGDDIDLLQNRDETECGFHYGPVQHAWQLIECHIPRKGRYLRFFQTWRQGPGYSMCLYEILIHGFV